eukprot:1339073-Prymnesium_polylepis.1
MALSVQGIKAAEEKLRADRSQVNEIVALIAACETETGSPRSRLAALQVCRSLFVHWANAGELSVHRSADDGEDASSGATSGGSAMDAYREWLHEKYRRFVAAVRR